MPVDDPTKLFNLSCDLLAAASTCLTDNGLAIPTNVYVSPCLPDLVCCSNLVVTPGRIDIIEQPDSRGKTCLLLRELHFDLYLERCVHVFTNDGRTPPIGSCADPFSGSITGDALSVLTDRWVILQCLVATLRAIGRPSPWCCNPVSIVQVEPVCEGLCAGTRFEITLTL